MIVKWILIGIGSILALGVIFFIIILTPWYHHFAFGKPAEKMLGYVNDHPEKSALTVIKNGEIIYEKNGDQPMPLASTYKIIVASAYAEKVVNQTLNPEELIALKELDKYYAPNTDGGAHPAWIKEITKEEKTSDGMVPLEEVVKGMIKYSSNANTEYLMDRIGLEFIESEEKRLGLSYSEKPYYFTSAMFIGNWLKVEKKQSTAEIEKKLKAMDDNEYSQLAATIHNELKEGIYKAGFGRISPSIDKIWSDRLIKGTTRDYAMLMSHIQTGNGLSKEKADILHAVLETEKGTGKKGGSTEFVLTEASYFKNKDGDDVSSALFLNNLTEKEQKTLFYIPTFVRIFQLGPFDGFSVALEANLLKLDQ
jgi:D-alanyl-D-alanine carboxypeptidase